MVEKMELNGPIQIKDNTNERVAFELMQYIAYNSNATPRTEDDYLNLYCRCLNTIERSAYGAQPSKYDE